MPLYSIQRLSPTAVLGLWHLTETPEALWAALPNAGAYQPLLPATADAKRQAQWLAGRRLAHALFGELPTPLPPETLVQNDPTGRPWLLGAPADTVVSLSHSGEWAAAVLAQGGRAGVDIELIRDKAQRLAGKFLAENEMAPAKERGRGHPPASFESMAAQSFSGQSPRFQASLIEVVASTNGKTRVGLCGVLVRSL